MPVTKIRPAGTFVDLGDGAGLVELPLPPEGPPGIPGLFSAASQAEAEAGINNTKAMTPLRDKQAFVAHQKEIWLTDYASGEDDENVDQSSGVQDAFDAAVAAGKSYVLVPDRYTFVLGTDAIGSPVAVDAQGLSIIARGRIRPQLASNPTFKIHANYKEATGGAITTLSVAQNANFLGFGVDGLTTIRASGNIARDTAVAIGPGISGSGFNCLFDGCNFSNLKIALYPITVGTTGQVTDFGVHNCRFSDVKHGLWLFGGSTGIQNAVRLTKNYIFGGTSADVADYHRYRADATELSTEAFWYLDILQGGVIDDAVVERLHHYLHARYMQGMVLNTPYLEALDVFSTFTVPTSVSISRGPTFYNFDATPGKRFVVDDGHAGFRNRCWNGGFDIDAEAAGPYSGAASWSMDGWSRGSNLTVTKTAFTAGQTGVPGEPKFYARLVAGAAGTTNSRFEFTFEDVYSIAAEKAVVLFYARAVNNSFEMTLRGAQNFGSGGSTTVLTAAGTSAHALADGTAWTRYRAQINIPSIATKTIGAENYLRVGFIPNFDAAGDEVHIANVQIVPIVYGESFAIPYERVPGSIRERLAQRSYVKLAARAFNGSTWIKWPGRMAAIPTVTATVGTVGNASVDGCLLTHTVGADTVITADARVTP